MRMVELVEVVSESGIFTDGDWVESKDQDPDGDVRLLQLADVGVARFVDKSNRFMTASAAQRLKCTYLEAGDIMIARMPDPIGRSCIFPGSSQACVTVVDVCILRHDPKIADRAYLNWVINSPPFQRTVASFIKGSTRQRISRKNLEKIEIPLPSLPDQRRIAQILDKADALRRKRAEALTRLNSLGQSIFHEMFGAWHTERSRWDMVDLGKEMDFLTSGSRGWAEYYTETGASFIRIQNVRRGYFDLDDMAFVNPPVSAEARRTKVQPRDVLMSITADLGRAAVVPDDIGEAHINQHLAIIRNSAFNPYFLVSALTSQSGHARGGGVN